MSFNVEWTCKINDRKVQECVSFEVVNHPFRRDAVNLPANFNVNKSLIMSLNKWSAPYEEVDPLLRMREMNVDEDLILTKNLDSVDYSKEWKQKRHTILNNYTTGEKLTIVSSYLPGGEKTLIRQVSNLNEKVKHRLEQLDEFEEGSVRKTMGLSQQEFVTKINMLNEEIIKAWDTEQRVKAFKIGIQCSKLLSDVNVMQFYPSKFVLISDILETFGNLVFERLKNKSFGNIEMDSFEMFDSESVPEQAKETCQNWMFKMASIRELLPRLYMEMSLLKCYLFLSKDEIPRAIARLTMMIRGIGNPLVAAYLRVYLCLVASKLLGKRSEHFFYDNLHEFLEEYQVILHPSITKKYEGQLLTRDQYLNLYVPALSWLLYGTLNFTDNKEKLLEDLLQKCEEIENNELLLRCITIDFDSMSINNKSAKILEMIQKQADKMVMLPEILTAFGEHLCAAGNCRQGASQALTQTWWKIASNIKSTPHFLKVLEPLLEFASTNLTTQHVNIILRGMIRYMVKCGKMADEFSGNFNFVIKRMLKSIPDVEEVFLMDAFMPLLELVQTTNARTLMAKTVLTIFFSRLNSVYIEDHIVIAGLMRLCCILHDSINAVTVEDETKICAELITKFVQAVTYHDNYEEQLKFYVDCRSAFIKLDAVLIALVHAVNALGARGGGARAQGRWVSRACAAYCFVTVPSLRCALTKAQLYLLSGQVAMLNNCIGQAEANFKALVSLVLDIPEFITEDGQHKQTAVKVEALLSNFLSTLLILPDNVDSNCKAYILSGFIQMLERAHWKKTEPLYYRTLLRTLDLLCEMTQETYAYHIDSVLSNDKLYGGDEEFIKAMEKYAAYICQELLVVLKLLSDAKETKKQYDVSLELFWRVVRRGRLEDTPMRDLAVKLWGLVRKLQDSNNKTAMSVLAALESDKNIVSQKMYAKLKEV